VHPEQSGNASAHEHGTDADRETDEDKEQNRKVIFKHGTRSALSAATPVFSHLS
jgi:hypothetical protein